MFSVTCNSTLCSLLCHGLSLRGWYWIGLSDSAHEGTWLWLNGNQANPDDGSLWGPGRPFTGSSGNNRDCADVHLHNSFRGDDVFFVHDTPCSNIRRALCEKPV